MHITMPIFPTEAIKQIMMHSLLATIFCTGLHAEQETKYDMEARRASVVNLTRHIQQRETRLNELRGDLKSMDSRIEKRSDELVKMLSEIHDSKESKIQVSQIKMKAIKGLRRWIQTYQNRRSRIVETLRQSGNLLPKDDLANDIDEFDKRIEKRITQIIKLSDSMGDYEDVDKYESTGGSYWGGYYHESTRINDDWKQNRRQTVMTDKTRRELTSALEAAIKTLESRRAGLENKLKNRSISDAEREISLGELGRIDGSLEHRRSDLKGLMEPKGSPTGRAVGRNKAHDIEKLLEDAGKDLSEDFHRLLRMYDELAEERTQCFKLNENLEARKAWLKKHQE
jgi:hypothetical protein